MNVDALEPRRHAPPDGWSREAFERVTDALAAALVAAVRRDEERIAEDVEPGAPQANNARP